MIPKYVAKKEIIVYNLNQIKYAFTWIYIKSEDLIENYITDNTDIIEYYPIKLMSVLFSY